MKGISACPRAPRGLSGHVKSTIYELDIIMLFVLSLTCMCFYEGSTNAMAIHFNHIVFSCRPTCMQQLILENIYVRIQFVIQLNNYS